MISDLDCDPGIDLLWGRRCICDLRIGALELGLDSADLPIGDLVIADLHFLGLVADLGDHFDLDLDFGDLFVPTDNPQFDLAVSCPELHFAHLIVDLDLEMGDLPYPLIDDLEFPLDLQMDDLEFHLGL